MLEKLEYLKVLVFTSKNPFSEVNQQERFQFFKLENPHRPYARLRCHIGEDMVGPP